jgi:hypothetical protein
MSPLASEPVTTENRTEETRLLISVEADCQAVPWFPEAVQYVVHIPSMNPSSESVPIPSPYMWYQNSMVAPAASMNGGDSSVNGPT